MRLEGGVSSFGKSRFVSEQYRVILTRDSITNDKSPLPPPAATEEEDEIMLQAEPYVEGPIKADYGYNIM